MASQAALDGIRANGLRWRVGRMGIADMSKKLGEIVDGDRDEAEAEAIAADIVAKLRAYRCADGRVTQDLCDNADELECIAECGIDEVVCVMGRVYDTLDYWRILA